MARASKIAFLLFKIFLSALILYLLISKIGGRAIVDNIRLSSPLAFIGAAGIYVLATYVSSLRWKILIPQQFGTKRLFGMYMIGSFFNTYLPGLVGGDGVKAYYLSRELKSRNAGSCASTDQELDRKSLDTGHSLSNNVIAIASVFMDRYVGIGALLFIGIAVFPFSFKYFEGSSSVRPVLWVIPTIFVLFLFVSIAIFRLRIGDRLKFLFRVYEYFHFYKSKRAILLKAFMYSLIVQLLNVLSVYILSKGISLQLTFFTFLIFVPVIILISFIPVSISGLGLREAAFVLLLGTTGVSPDQSVTLSLLWFLSVVVASFWGLFEYVRFKANINREI